ncbi:ribonuclease domain-containing protein [Campylobacter showae]|uniref:ribonuclease domain-containing protein n=1 Tax=Campylobacter showae TaxID=204 RepID=UPI000F090EDE|nr:ribonuclease domain-containing protein [Campylobacter showae]
MNKQLLRNVILPLAVLLLVALFKFIIPDSSSTTPKQNHPQSEFRGSSGIEKNIAAVPTANVVKDGTYTSKDEVAAYIYKFGELPQNFITKKEALALGWDAKSGNLWQVTDKKSIGGDRFSNREKKLPEASGRKWFECDIGYRGGRRGAERIVFSSDGLIYYTPDHYENFYLLYERRRQ